MRSANRRRKTLALLILLAIAGLAADLYAGYSTVSLPEFWALFTGAASRSVRLTIVEFRLPRVLLSLLVGGGLAVSGCVLQGVSRNDLADPGVLGINAGAGLGVAVCVTAFSQSLQGGSLWIPLAALAGACLAALAVYLLSHRENEGISSGRMVLTGVAVAAALNAATVMLLLRMRQDEYGFVAGWLSGNLWGANWANVRTAAPWIVVLLALVLYQSNALNILSLGRQHAMGLGVPVRRQSLVLLAGAVGLSAICAAVGGGISFVGLVCPHLARRLVGSRHQCLVPAAALTGACLMLISDILSRAVASGGETPIGIVATVLSAPYFLYLLVNRKGG